MVRNTSTVILKMKVLFSLTHLVEDRPKLKDLIEHELLLAAEKEVDVSKWYTEILEKEKDVSKPDLCTS